MLRYSDFERDDVTLSRDANPLTCVSSIACTCRRFAVTTRRRRRRRRIRPDAELVPRRLRERPHRRRESQSQRLPGVRLPVTGGGSKICSACVEKM